MLKIVTLFWHLRFLLKGIPCLNQLLLTNDTWLEPVHMKGRYLSVSLLLKVIKLELLLLEHFHQLSLRVLMLVQQLEILVRLGHIV